MKLRFKMTWNELSLRENHQEMKRNIQEELNNIGGKKWPKQAKT
jgi:hypothetical protein